MFMKSMMMMATFAMMASDAALNPTTIEVAFYDHMKKYGLDFHDGAEFGHRLEIFTERMYEIAIHNADNGRTYDLGPNQFSHLTFEEFKETVGLLEGGLLAPTKSFRGGLVKPVNVSALPAEVDWVTAGAVTPVKNQGQCGSCWTFSTTGALEGAYFTKWGTLQSFSEQELVSCDTTDNQCNGGWMDSAFEWVQKNGGLAYEADYPYVSGDGVTIPACNKDATYQDPKVIPTSWVDVPAKSVSSLMAAVAQQPVSIAIQANQAAFQSYAGGVLTGRCGTRLDHGVLLVGYGTSADGVDYWKIKNSWGAGWGMDGYILIERSTADLCGVLDAASYPVL